MSKTILASLLVERLQAAIDLYGDLPVYLHIETAERQLEFPAWEIAVVPQGKYARIIVMTEGV